MDFYSVIVIPMGKSKIVFFNFVSNVENSFLIKLTRYDSGQV